MNVKQERTINMTSKVQWQDIQPAQVSLPAFDYQAPSQQRTYNQEQIVPLQEAIKALASNQNTQLMETLYKYGNLNNSRTSSDVNYNYAQPITNKPFNFLDRLDTSFSKENEVAEFKKLGELTGLDPSWLMAVSDIESSRGKNNRRITERDKDGNPTKYSQYQGMFQIGEALKREYGLTDEDLYDWGKSAQAFTKFVQAGDYKGKPFKDIGHAYFAWQQGKKGAYDYIQDKNINRNVIDVLTTPKSKGGRGLPREKAIEIVTKNGGNIDMTSGDFANLWIGKANTRQEKFSKLYV